MRHHWNEIELSKLAALIRAVDDHLQDICERSVEVENADAFGLYESAEHATGLGFVACQTYMASVYSGLGISKQRALEFGPKDHGGLTKVQVINHAANFWKHNNEWPFDRSATRREAIENAFESVGFPVGVDYPLSGVLTELCDPLPASLRTVVAVLEAWESELQGTA